jgi:transposase-like protein
MSSPEGQRAVPYYCPYCGGEDLRPYEAPDSEAGRRSGWECRECARVFAVTLIGLVVSG